MKVEDFNRKNSIFLVALAMVLCSTPGALSKMTGMIKKWSILVILAAAVFALPSIALAVQEDPPATFIYSGSTTKGNIVPNRFDLKSDTISAGWGEDPYGKPSGADKNPGNKYGDGIVNSLNNGKEKNWAYYEQGRLYSLSYKAGYTGSDPSVGGVYYSSHPYGTWNSPYTIGIDGFNYNDAQDYVADGDQDISNGYRFRSGPHGGYKTTTHRCRECHAVHRAAGKFKLTRSDTRFEACDWCHGTGAGSGFNIQMDNDDNYTTEYNVGHTIGYGMRSGKWRAPDDTYPAYTPNYWMGGFSCFDCHSPHANPARLLGYDDNGQVKGLAYADIALSGGGGAYNEETRYYSIINPGHGDGNIDLAGASVTCVDCHKQMVDTYSNFVSGTPSAIPLYLSGKWLLIKNADREVAETSEVVSYYRLSDILDTTGTIETTQVVAGKEISDMIYAHTQIVDDEPTVTAGKLYQFDAGKAYPVNKIPIDWNTPVGIAQAANGSSGFDVRSAIPNEPSHALLWNVSEFCTDCHDGNAGLHTVAAPLFSEDRALRSQEGTDTTTWKGNYDIAYGHDQNPRHCGRQMKFNPEDSTVFGPNCRNCHKGSSACGRCHSESSAQTSGGANNYNGIYPSQPPYAEMQALALTAMNNYDRIPGGYVQAEDEFGNLMYDEYGNPILLAYDKYPGIQGASMYHVKKTSTGESNMVNDYTYPPNTGYSPHGLDSHNADLSYMYKKSRTATWYTGWRTATGFVQMGKMMSTGTETGAGVDCSDDGFSWPHRTLGWKMLKDDLFGLDFDGDVVSVGDTRTTSTNNDSVPETYTVHDLDSVCLDCHNPTVWRAISASDHEDTSTTNADNHDDELLTRGLP